MRIASWLALMLLLVTWSSPAMAGKKAGITMPDSVTVTGKKLVLNGMGLREATVFKVDVYVAGLYLEQKSSDGAAILSSKQIKRIHLEFKRDVDRDDIQDAWHDGFKKVAGKNFGVFKERLTKVNSWMEPIDEGDSITFTHVPEKGLEVLVNGKRKGVVPGDDFAQTLFTIWLGSNPPNKGLRSGLLGR